LTIFSKTIDSEAIVSAIMTSSSKLRNFTSKAKLSEAVLNPMGNRYGMLALILRPKTHFLERSCSLFLAKFRFSSFWGFEIRKIPISTSKKYYSRTLPFRDQGSISSGKQFLGLIETIAALSSC
jgi:hypothetical protein